MTALAAGDHGWDVLLDLDDLHPSGVVAIGAGGVHGEVRLVLDDLLAV